MMSFTALANLISMDIGQAVSLISLAFLGVTKKQTKLGAVYSEIQKILRGVWHICNLADPCSSAGVSFQSDVPNGR